MGESTWFSKLPGGCVRAFVSSATRKSAEIATRASVMSDCGSTAGPAARLGDELAAHCRHEPESPRNLGALYLDERKSALNAWADYVLRLVGELSNANVVDLRTRGRSGKAVS